jgi:hypothetical protein
VYKLFYKCVLNTFEWEWELLRKLLLMRTLLPWVIWYWVKPSWLLNTPTSPLFNYCSELCCSYLITVFGSLSTSPKFIPSKYSISSSISVPHSSFLLLVVYSLFFSFCLLLMSFEFWRNVRRVLDPLTSKFFAILGPLSSYSPISIIELLF